jgi:anti-sigma-K factor RskA
LSGARVYEASGTTSRKTLQQAVCVLNFVISDLMLDEHTTALASRYVLGAVTPEERLEFETTLRKDRRLQLLVKELRGTQGGELIAADKEAAARSHSDHQALGESAPPTPSLQPGLKTSEWLFWASWLLCTCFVALCVLLLSSVRAQRESVAELGRRSEQQQREIAKLRQQNLRLQATAAEQATNYHQRIRDLESNLMKGVEQLTARTAAATNQLQQRLDVSTRDLIAARKELSDLSNVKIALEHAVATLGTRDRNRFKTARLFILRSDSNPEGSGGNAAGAVLWSPEDQRGILIITNLRPLRAAEAYQLWLVETGTKAPVSGGLVALNGNPVQAQFTTQTRVGSIERAFLTIESAIGAKTPGQRTVLSSE